jgi:hypothetical protein
MQIAGRIALSGETVPNITSRTFGIPSPFCREGESNKTNVTQGEARAARCGRPRESPAQPSNQSNSSTMSQKCSFRIHTERTARSHEFQALYARIEVFVVSRSRRASPKARLPPWRLGAMRVTRNRIIPLTARCGRLYAPLATAGPRPGRCWPLFPRRPPHPRKPDKCPADGSSCCPWPSGHC